MSQDRFEKFAEILDSNDRKDDPREPLDPKAEIFNPKLSMAVPMGLDDVLDSSRTSTTRPQPRVPQPDPICTNRVNRSVQTTKTFKINGFSICNDLHNCIASFLDDPTKLAYLLYMGVFIKDIKFKYDQRNWYKRNKLTIPLIVKMIIPNNTIYKSHMYMYTKEKEKIEIIYLNYLQ